MLGQLTHLDVSRLPLQGVGIENVASYGQLIYLNISHCEQLRDETIVAVARASNSLCEVNIRGCTSLTDASIVALTTHCAQLSHLITWGSNLTDSAAEAIAQHCVNMHTLSFTSPLLTSVSQLTQMCTQLNRLNVTSDRLFELGNYLRCTQLEHLSIDSRSLRNEGVDGLFRNCPRLLSIQLVRTRFLTDISIVTLVQNSPMLMSIKLVGMPRISNTSVYAIARHCTALEKLRFGFCQYISDDPMDTLVVACPRLSEVEMWYCQSTSYTKILERARRRCRRSTSTSSIVRWLSQF